MVYTPPPIVDTIRSPLASVVVMTSPSVSDDEVAAADERGVEETASSDKDPGTDDRVSAGVEASEPVEGVAGVLSGLGDGDGGTDADADADGDGDPGAGASEDS